MKNYRLEIADEWLKFLVLQICKKNCIHEVRRRWHKFLEQVSQFADAGQS